MRKGAHTQTWNVLEGLLVGTAVGASFLASRHMIATITTYELGVFVEQHRPLEVHFGFTKSTGLEGNERCVRE